MPTPVLMERATGPTVWVGSDFSSKDDVAYDLSDANGPATDPGMRSSTRTCGTPTWKTTSARSTAR